MKLISTFSTFFLLFISFFSTAQNTDTSVLRLWNNNDVVYNAPKASNPLLPGYYADPTVIEDNGTYYVYATSDLLSWNDINKLAVWSSKDFVNWKCDYLNWPTKELCKTTTGTTAGVWAPSVIKAPNGKFYMYVTVGQEIWVGVADNLRGPWKNALPNNQPLIRHKEYFYVETIDSECFIDDDGQAYLYWGSSNSGFDIEGRCLAVKLNADMISFTGEPRDITPPHYFEAPYMFKKNGLYYFMYSWGHTWDETYQVRYSTGPTPLGPWTEGMMRPILGTEEKDDRIKSTGHNTILKNNNDYYILYHRFNTVNNYDIAAKLRQVCADKLEFNSDGSLQRVITTNAGVGALKPVTTKVNLAFGAKVTSSSDLDSVCKAAYVTDENNGTLWIGGKYANESVTIDLGSMKTFSEINIFPEYPIYIYRYKIEISGDGDNWNLADDQLNNTKNGSPLTTSKKLSARYVRISMQHYKTGPRLGIWEVKIYQ